MPNTFKLRMTYMTNIQTFHEADDFAGPQITICDFNGKYCFVIFTVDKENLIRVEVILHLFIYINPR